MKNYEEVKRQIEELNSKKVQLQQSGEEILINALNEYGGEIELDFEFDENVCIAYDGDGNAYEANPCSSVYKIFLKDGKVYVEFEEDFWPFELISTDEQINLLEVIFEQTIPRLQEEEREEKDEESNEEYEE